MDVDILLFDVIDEINDVSSNSTMIGFESVNVMKDKVFLLDN
jgi:hypothetical protein